MVQHYAETLRVAQRSGEFEAQRWTDYALIPYWLLRWVYALLWTLLAGAWRMWRMSRRDGVYRPWAWMWGRHDSPEPSACPRCLWMGMVRWHYHGYRSDGAGDVEACDECPRCGYEI